MNAWFAARFRTSELPLSSTLDFSAILGVVEER